MPHPTQNIQNTQDTQKTLKTLTLIWPLILGMLMIMVGFGLQGTLLALRAELDGFLITAIGVIMSLYYCGYLAGWFVIPRMINSVGHIRVFASFASMASTTILIQGLFVYPYIWAIIRLISGFCFVGLFIVAESWLNNTAPNKLRGQITSIYISVVNGGIFTGQFLINLGSVQSIGLFALISILISLSLLPVTLANKPTPGYKEIENLPFKKLIAKSPLAVLCVFCCGFVNAGMLTMGPVFASKLGLTIPKISLLMALFVLGCATMPLINGWLSDRIDRRKVIVGVSTIGLIAASLITAIPALIFICAYFVGGSATSIYSIGSAMMNDRLKPSQMTSATATLILISGIGSCISPVALGFTMENFGITAFFMIFAAIFALNTVFGLYRNFTGPEIIVEQQGDYHNLPYRSTHGIGALTEPDRD